MQSAAEQGQEEVVNALAVIQETAAQLSTFGQQMSALAEEEEVVIQDVAAEIEVLGDTPTRDDLVNLVITYAGDDQRLQALVGLVRPAFDYEFFQELTLRIGKAPGPDRKRLEDTRSRLLQFTQMIDQQTQSAMQSAAQLLQMIINSEDIDTALQENVAYIDDTFMAILAANIQEAERRGDLQMGGLLKNIYTKVVGLLQAKMRPELRFINDILATEDDEAALAMLPQGIELFGQALVDIMDSIGRMLGQRGQQELVEKLAFLREAAIRQLNSEPS